MSLDTRILLIGDSTYKMYSQAFYDAWIKLGYQNIVYFRINDYLDADSEKNRPLLRLCLRFEYKTAFGVHVKKMNKQLLRIADQFQPQLVFLYNIRHIYAQTLMQLKKSGSIIFFYSNDNPFGNYYPAYYWRHFRRGLSIADTGFVYREKNISDFKNAGCKIVHQLRSYYIEERNHYVENPSVQVPKVVFLGHYENDERGEYIKALLDRKIEVGIIKTSWESFEEGNPYLVKLENTQALYNEMLNAAEIAIVFLSKINQDTYTRRCFEIPATKTLMIAPYTEDIAAMFTVDEEVVIYSDKEEFVEKICYYLKHDAERKRIAEAGYRRLIAEKHEVTDRVKFILEIYEQIHSDKLEA